MTAQHDHLVEVAPVIEAAILAQVEILQAQQGRRKTRRERVVEGRQGLDLDSGGRDVCGHRGSTG
ncbi:MAG TPA: hypothetical protein PLG99_12225, partial [Kaistiaceae bacterium]|nr:hypothetical protein [Kaistiaceae bacterium]